MKGSFKQKTTIRTKRQSIEAEVTEQCHRCPAHSRVPAGFAGSGAAWCHGGDAFAGQLEKGSGYIWSQPLTGEHLKRCLVPLTEQGKEEQSVSSGSKRSLVFFTQKLFAERTFQRFIFIFCLFCDLLCEARSRLRSLSGEQTR